MKVPGSSHHGELFYATGMRVSELISIQFEDIDFYQNRVKILGREIKKGGSPLGNRLVKL